MPGRRERLGNAVLSYNQTVRDAYPAYKTANAVRPHILVRQIPEKTYSALQKFQNMQRAVCLAPLKLLTQGYARLQIYVLHVPYRMKRRISCNRSHTYLETINRDGRSFPALCPGGHWRELKMISDPPRRCMDGYYHLDFLCELKIHLYGSPCGIHYPRSDRHTTKMRLWKQTAGTGWRPYRTPRKFSFPESVMRGCTDRILQKSVSCAAQASGNENLCNGMITTVPCQHETRQAETDRFTKNETSVVKVATGAISMSLNLPSKESGISGNGRIWRILSPGEDLLRKKIQQIAGRAGRNIYECGAYAASQEKRSFIRSSMTVSVNDTVCRAIGFPRMLIEWKESYPGKW